jgi:hypothetical protein
MARYITELLSAANENPALLATPAYKDSYAIRSILEYAFDKRHKMVLPSGCPPYKQDTAPLGMTPANFYQVVKKFYVFKRLDVARVKLEAIFIQTLEGLHPSEADILVAIKDQNLETLYPNITTDVVVKAGYVPVEFAKEKVEVAQPEPKSEEVVQDPNAPKHLVVTIDDSTSVEDQPGGAPPVKRGRGRPKKASA